MNMADLIIVFAVLALWGPWAALFALTVLCVAAIMVGD
jgi:hypothetical protein